MSAPLSGKISRGLSGRGISGLEKFIDQSATELQRVAHELDGFSGGSTNADAAQSSLQQMRAYARQASLGSGQSMTGSCARAGGGGSAGSGFDPLARNQCNGGACGRSQTLSGADAELQAMAEAGGGSGYFEDRVFALMIKIVEDYQKQIEKRLQKLQQEAQAAEAQQGMGGGGGGGNGQESRNIEFEKIKFDMQKLSQMQQALSNILNTMDELAKSAIRHIKAG